MQIINIMKNDTKESKWIVDQFNQDFLFVDDSFQRRYVWHEKHKVKLIETILLGYAIPEIYLWDTDTNPDTGNTKRSIVDGQQRIGALVTFINNEYKLKKIYLDEKGAQYVDKFFSELSSEDKNKIWKYTFSFRIIPEGVLREDIVKLFLRLNSTDKSLNPQELRNAEFDGLFLKTAEQIANYEFWKKYSIFSVDNIRRMGDIEFISSLLIFLRLGIASEITQKAINSAYDLFDREYNEAEEDKDTIKKILDEIEKIIELDEAVLPFLRRTTHLYAIMVVSYKAITIKGGLTEENRRALVGFYKSYPELEGVQAEKYKSLMADSTRSKKSRIERCQVLSEIIGVE